MFFLNNYFYIILILQAVCVIHCLRRGRSTMWIWVIVFLPLIGCIAYVAIEMFNRGQIQQLQSGLGNALYPAGKIKRLEEQVRFSDTFNNKVALADAYLASGDTQKAIELYEGSLTGAFTDNDHVLMQLVVAYFTVERYADVIKIAKKIYRLPQFSRSHAHILYAMSLEKTGNYTKAEDEFKIMKVRYSYFEGRYQYGMFLLRSNRAEEAQKIFRELVDEFSYLSSFEKRNNRLWFNQAKDELKKVTTAVHQHQGI